MRYLLLKLSPPQAEQDHHVDRHARQVCVALHKLCQSDKYVVLQHTILGEHQECGDLVSSVVGNDMGDIGLPRQCMDMKDTHLLSLARRIEHLLAVLLVS